MTKVLYSAKLSEECDSYINKMINRYGITKTSAIEMAVREFYYSNKEKLEEINQNTEDK